MVTQHDGFDISVFWSFFGVTVVETQVLFVVEHEVDESQIYNESKNTFFKKKSIFVYQSFEWMSDSEGKW